MIFKGKAGVSFEIIYPVGSKGKYVNVWIKGEHELLGEVNLGGTWWVPTAYYHHKGRTFATAIAKYLNK